MKKMKNITLSIIALIGLMAPIAMPTVAFAAEENIEGGLSCGANIDFSGKGCDKNTKGAAGEVDSLVVNIVNVLSLVVGTVAVIMIIIGGLQYVMSGGDSGKVGNSKNTILYAVVGLVVVALAQVIVKFTIQSTKSTVTE